MNSLINHCLSAGMKIGSMKPINLSLDLLSPFNSAPFHPHSKKGAQSKSRQTKMVTSFHGNTRRNVDGTWKGSVDSFTISHTDRPSDDEMFSNVYEDDEFYYDSAYLHVCTVNQKTTKDPPIYKNHWLIASGASIHITPYLEDFTSLLQGERLASTTNGSIIQMHGPGTIILKQDIPKAPLVLLTGA